MSSSYFQTKSQVALVLVFVVSIFIYMATMHFTAYCNIFEWLLDGMYDLFNPIRAGGAESARTFFRWQFLHEKRGLEVQNFVTFPNSL